MNVCARGRAGAIRWFVVVTAIWAGIRFSGDLFADDSRQGRLLFLGVAYDEGPPPGHTVDHFNYASDNFLRLFQNQSKELFSSIEVTALKGNGAVRPRVAAAFRDLQAKARQNDLFFLYWGTHGGTDRKGWSVNLPGGTQLYGSEIKDALARFPCPCVCVISTCGSGGFANESFDGFAVPENAVAFCACRGQQSTSNELDRALCEALAGFGDTDESGEVTLREAIDYVPKRYRKWYPADAGKEGQIPVTAFAESPLLDRPVTKVNGTHAAVVHDGAWYGATVLGDTGGGKKVRFLGYDSTTRNGGFSFPDAVVSSESIDLPGGEKPIEVKWEGAWYPAQILKRERDGLLIHYIGYPSSDDEKVPRNRVRFPFGDPNDPAELRRKPGSSK